MAKYKNPFDLVLKKAERRLAIDFPRAVGRLGVNHFRDSFDMQRFNEPGSQPWPDVKRRDPESKWYGFKYGNKARRPGVATRSREGRGNFSQARTTNRILQVTGKLQQSIHVKQANIKKVTWAASAPGAQLHNRGGRFRIFGKKVATMPKRQFMGPSTRMMGQVRQLARKEFKSLFR